MAPTKSGRQNKLSFTNGGGAPEACHPGVDAVFRAVIYDFDPRLIDVVKTTQ